jgi:hypothetical protein
MKGKEQELVAAVAALHGELARLPDPAEPLARARLQAALGEKLLQLSYVERFERTQEAWQAFWDALGECTSERDLDLWAKAQSGLAAAWVRIGKGPHGTYTLFRRAEDCYRAVLAAYPRSKNPEAWAVVHSRLAQALVAMAERDSDPDRARLHLRQAADSFGQAQSVFTKEQFPDNWERLQQMLAQAREIEEELAQRESGKP